MSGPKCLMIMPCSSEAEARYLNQRASMQYLGEYARMFGELSSIVEKIGWLGIKADVPVMSVDELRTQIEILLSSGSSIDAVRFCLSEKQRLEEHIVISSDEFKRLSNEIGPRVRLQALAQKRESILLESARMKEYEAAISSDWPEEARSKVKGIIAEALSRIRLPDAIAPVFNLETMKKIDEADASIKKTHDILAEGKKAVEEAMKKIRTKLLTGKLMADLPPLKTLTDYLNDLPAASRPSQEENRYEKKLDKLLIDIVLLQDTGGWVELMAKAEAIKLEREPRKRRMLYENLVIECSTRLKQIRELRRWQAEVNKMIDSAADLRGTAEGEVVLELEEMLRSAHVVDLNEMKVSVKKVLEAEKKRAMREEKRRVILEALKELGYDTKEGMEAALMKAGRLEFQRPNDDYAVEVVVDNELDMLQTILVRHAESDDSTEQQRLRDKEREISWCGEHAKLRQKLDERGFGSRFKLKVPAGQFPVQVIIEQGRTAVTKKTVVAKRGNLKQRSG